MVSSRLAEWGPAAPGGEKRLKAILSARFREGVAAQGGVLQGRAGIQVGDCPSLAATEQERVDVANSQVRVDWMEYFLAQGDSTQAMLYAYERGEAEDGGCW